GQAFDAVELEQREIDAAVATDDLPGEAAPVEEPNLRGGDVLNDVRVRHDHAFRIDDESGAARAALLRFLAIVTGGRRLASHAHVDDRGLELLGQIGQQVIE